MTDLSTHKQAILAALSANWEEALKINEQIIKLEPENVDALNRLARAHFELGDLSASRKFYQKALNNDPYNQIAYKFLKRMEGYTQKGLKSTTPKPSINLISDFLIEEPGKCKHVTLLKVAEPQRLSMLVAGEPVILVAKNRGVVVTEGSGKYLGVIPDDLSRKLIKFMRGGNKYQALIKTIKANSITILIRETYRSARFKNQPSFLDTLSGSLAYSSDHIIVPQDESEEEALGEEEAVE